MSAEIIALRNTVSGVAHEYPKDRAEKILAHPVWGKINEVVRTAKPEVLAVREIAPPIEDSAVVEAPASEKKVK